MDDKITAIKRYFTEKAANVLKPPTGKLKRPYIDPGEGYGGELWDWDSYFTARALCYADKVFSQAELQKVGLDPSVLERHVKGSILNFLDAQESDGYTPVMVAGGGLFDGYFKGEYDRGEPLNQHKPFLCQAVANACERFGDHGWFDVEKLVRYLEYYENKQYDKDSGLFFWQDDIMIGVDNNPTVFFRPPRTCADIYLNSFVYAEYIALVDILNRLGDARADEFSRKAERLKSAVNREMWDERDGIYYSQDIGYYRCGRKIGDFEFHSGQSRKWVCTPLKIRFWGCFAPLYVGIADGDKAARLCKHLTEDDSVLAKYGIRSLASNEKMYDLEKSSNPSNWLGAAWFIADYIIYKGLLRYGMTDIAEKLRAASVELIGGGLIKYGDMFESYHPDTGEPFLHPGFLSWNLLVLEMV